MDQNTPQGHTAADVRQAEADAEGPSEGIEPRAKPEGRYRFAKRAGSLLIELLVVFAGVYGAFLLDRFQEEQRDATRRTAIYQALKIDVERTKRRIQWHRDWLETKYIETIVQPYERGEQPTIVGLWLPSASQSGAWSAMVEVGVDLLDPAFIQEVESHRATVQFMMDQSNRAVQLSDTRIGPLLGEHDFYGDDGRLLLRHRWYPQLLGYLAGNADRAADSAERLEAELERRLKND